MWFYNILSVVIAIIVAIAGLISTSIVARGTF